MTKSKQQKGGGMKETFTGIYDSMENFVNENVFNKNSKPPENKVLKKDKDKEVVKKDKDKEDVNKEDSLEDHHTNYNLLESM